MDDIQRTPMRLDVAGYHTVSPPMWHKRGHAVVVHRVSQVADENSVESVADHLANAETSAQHAHVGVHAAHDHVGDSALLEEVVNFLAAVGDGVAVGDFDGRMFAF